MVSIQTSPRPAVLGLSRLQTLSLALLLAGCAQIGKPPSTDVPSPPAAVEKSEDSADPPSPTQPQPAPLPVDINKLIANAEDLLQAGNEDGARAELQRVFAVDPNHRLAQLVLRQLSDDPIARLGRESFAYTVKGGDTMSKLARQYLGDIHLFYLLARYNSIKVPRQLQEGQVIRIPGKAPAVVAAPAPAPVTAPPATAPAAPPAPVKSEADKLLERGRAALRTNDIEPAWNLFLQAEKLGHPEARALALDARKRLVANHTSQARTALARQDLNGALKGWNKVLSIDPENETARIERKKVEILIEKAGRL